MRENSATPTHVRSTTVPAGFEPDVWVDAGYRDVYRSVGMIESSGDPLRCPLVTVVGRQYPDGRLEHLKVELDTADPTTSLTAAHGRSLARLLDEAAEVVDALIAGGGA